MLSTCGKTKNIAEFMKTKVCFALLSVILLSVILLSVILRKKEAAGKIIPLPLMIFRERFSLRSSLNLWSKYPEHSSCKTLQEIDFFVI